LAWLQWLVEAPGLHLYTMMPVAETKVTLSPAT